MAAQGMTLRNMHLVGGTNRRVELPPAHRPMFEEGAALIFMRWTALQLGVQNEWGGSKSVQKAQELLQDVIQWFYTTKGEAHRCPKPPLHHLSPASASLCCVHAVEVQRGRLSIRSSLPWHPRLHCWLPCGLHRVDDEW